MLSARMCCHVKIYFGFISKTSIRHYIVRVAFIDIVTDYRMEIQRIIKNNIALYVIIEKTNDDYR